VEKTTTPQTNTSAANKKPAKAKKPKLSYNDQRELGSLPGKIEKLEKQQALLEETMSEPGFFQSDHEQVQRVSKELADMQEKLEVAFNRWDELEDKD